MLITPIVPAMLDGKQIFLKRDDTYSCNGICGGKVRSCLAIARSVPNVQGLITAGARHSPQIQIVARVAQSLGVPARCHTSIGELTPELLDAQARGAEIIQHKPGHNSVIIARANADAQAHPDWAYLPFGMECQDAVTQNRKQYKYSVETFYHRTPWKGVVMVLGSGMSAAGVLHGMHDAGHNAMPFIGVRIGADPVKRLDKWAPAMWRMQSKIIDVTEWCPYSHAIDASIGDIKLDPHYEAKVVPYIQAGWLFWIVGIRAEV